jgi:hypothetical protein
MTAETNTATSAANEPTSLTITGTLRFVRRGQGARKEAREGAVPVVPVGRVPRVARLMALALKFDALIRSGQVTDQAELARLGGVTRARLTQIMNLTLLAPDLQEELLFLASVTAGRDPLVLRALQSLATELDWNRQRALWARMRKNRQRT